MVDRYPIGPIALGIHDWAYVEEDHLEVYHQACDRAGNVRSTEVVTLPWHIVRVALAKRYKRKAPRKQAVSKGGR